MKKKITGILVITILAICFCGLLSSQKSYAAYNPFPTSQTFEYNGRMYTTVPCTRYAWQQAYDRLGIELPMRGNATDWDDEAKKYGYPTGTTPRANSIAVWEKTDDNAWGHVAFVTGVNGNTITYNEGGTANSRANSQGIYEGHTLPDGYTDYPSTYIYLDGYAEYYIDLNWKVDGTEVWYSDVPGTVDVYINGKLVKSNADDYYEKWPAGTTYEFKNRKDKSGYEYSSVTGNTKGTLSNGNVATYFNYKTKKVAVSSDWVQSSTGTWTYWAIPAGFDKNHALYSKYQGQKLESYENATTKVVAEAPVQSGWIYYHWTHNMYALSNGNYNVFISDKYQWEGNREYYNFRAFESTNDHGHTDKNGIYGGNDVYYSWGDNPVDGSWWWFRVPLYSQKYTAYTKKVEQTIDVSGISLNKTSLTLVTGGTETLTATVTPGNATNKTVTWSSNNTKVATVSNGKVTAVGAGTATITAKAGNKSVTCSVTVNNPTIEVSGVSLNKTSLALVTGGTETLTATVTPGNATNKTVSWSSSNSDVATVDAKGKITAIAAGTATITVKAEKKSATCSVTVSELTIDVTSVVLSKKELSLSVGESEKLSATVYPLNASDKNVTWLSSDNTVVTVKDGVVTAVSAGTSVVTAKAGSKTGSCTVTVLDNSNVEVDVIKEDDNKDEKSSVLEIGDEEEADKDLDYNFEDFENESGESEDADSGESVDEEENRLPIGTSFKIKNGPIYKVTDVDEVTITGISSADVTTLTIPGTIMVEGCEYEVYSIQKNAFKNNKKLKRVTFKADLTGIEDGAFTGCKSLERIDIMGDIDTIGRKAFYNCPKLKQIYITTDVVPEIGLKAFKKIYSKVAVKVPTGMVAEYKKVLKKAGLPSKAVVK